ncbi:hypothetical protein FF011L_47450 [Roseimaritima multifibrata]|uniref:DUF4350 domain-containing protein n=2 Tax=Roseimaritima multifibrata TaxID=1930274 RepID=A0A517MM36_9BACT|nr:hypothetical protein FF011L_47450 [Roseimaritima multifibrata]
MRRLCGLFCAVLLGAAGAFADSPDTPGSPPSAEPVRIGVDGQYRVGQWTPVRVPFDGPLQLETVDGDGVRVRYRDTADNPASSLSQWRYVIPGKAAAPLVVRSQEGTVQREARFADQPIAVDRRWVMILGDPIGVDQLGANELLNQEATVATTIVTDAADLPDHWLGYDSLDGLVISAGSAPLLDQISDASLEAILTWVERGGFVLVTFGENAVAAYREDSLVGRLLPYQKPPVTFQMEPSAIESFTNSQRKLEPFMAAVLPVEEGEAVLVGRLLDRRPLPFAMRYRRGLGNVVAIAADLDQAPFEGWEQRNDLLAGMAADLFPSSPPRSKPPRSSDIHYNDMAGQIRANLDRFANAGSLPFAILAALLILLFLYIGPIDFLLVNRWLKRPLLGWLTFPVMIAAVSLFLISWTLKGQYAQPQLNRLEIIDINGIQKTGRGFRWDVLYASQAAKFDVSLSVSDSFRSSISEEKLSGPFTAPFGYSGAPFGGIEIQLEDQRLPAYDVFLDWNGKRPAGSMSGLPLAPSSSKGFASWWDFDFTPDVGNRLARRNRAELIGALPNPLSVDILDGMLLDRDRVYTLPSRFRAGQTIERVEDLRPRLLRWLLTKRKKVGDLTSSEPWDQAEDSDLAKVAEVFGFYGIAGGESYTGLANDPLRQFDLSEILTDETVLLIGRLEEPSTTLKLTASAADGSSDSEASALPVSTGQAVSLVRILLPVQADR